MPADDIARLYDFTAGTTIQSGQVDGEFNQLVSTINTKFGRGIANTLIGNNTFSGDNTFSGINTFSHASSPIKSDFILEYTSAAGVTVDGLLIKDGGANALVFHPGFVTGRYYPPYGANAISTSGTAGVGINADTKTVAVPFYVGKPTTFDRIAIYVNTAVGASTVQLAIYNTGSNGRPTTRVLDAGTVSSASTGAKEATISQLLTPGWYWLAARASSASIAISAWAQTDAVNRDIFGVSSLSAAGTLDTQAYQDSATIPSTFTSSPTAVFSGAGTAAPLIWLRAA